MKVSVLGAGAIGSMFGGLLRRDAPGVDVTLIGRGEHGRVMNDRQSVTLEGPWGVDEVSIRCSLDPADVAGSDLVLLTVKSQATESAASAGQAYWGGATIVSIQNGINDHLLADYVEPQRLVMGMTAINAAIVEPARVSLQLGGATILGPPAGQPPTDVAAPIVKLLRRIRCRELEFHAHRNALGMRYNKLAVNALGYASCLSASNFITEAMACRRWRDAVGLPLLEECHRVFQRAGVRLKRVPGMPGLQKLRLVMRAMRWPVIGPAILGEARRRFNRRPIVFSLLQDLMHGKPTEVDHINGEVMRLAATADLAAPLNAEVVRMVRELEQRRDGSFFTLEEVIDRFRRLTSLAA